MRLLETGFKATKQFEFSIGVYSRYLYDSLPKRSLIGQNL